MIECRNIAKGKAKGELIVSTEPISFLGGVNPENGEIIDPTHELLALLCLISRWWIHRLKLKI